MPNTRRRRFSVQHEIAGSQKIKNIDLPKSSELELKTQNYGKRSDKRNEYLPNSSKVTSSTLEIVAEIDNMGSVTTIKDNNTTTTKDKDVSASRSNIDLLSLMVSVDNSSVYSVTPAPPPRDTLKKRDIRLGNRDGSSKGEKLLHHRVKVRSPKRRSCQNTDTVECAFVQVYKEDKSTDAIAWEGEQDVGVNSVCNASEYIEESRLSNHSMEDMCRICHGGEALSSDLGTLISACMCRGTVGRVHVKCLERWLTESGKSRCEICGTRYATRRVHRYGVPRAIVMWLLSQNAKQLMVDSLGIMLMSPLAILAAWLSGRTLSGLMTQDATVTPWPLASTFVLACMTLVCYYCWIVSAATRHALGWWIWYRSQYEVHLQLQNDDP